MWKFDKEKTDRRISLLNEYYAEQGLNACDFRCSRYFECEKSQNKNTLKQFSGGTSAVMPLFDVMYNDMPIRVLVIGKETGYMKNSEYGTSKNFETNNLNALNCINWEKKNNHIKGTLYILQYIYNIKTEYVYSSYALTNMLRCSFQSLDKFCNVSGTKDTQKMRENCVIHLINEIKILEPTIIITQGEWAIRGRGFIDILRNAFGRYTCLKMNSAGKYGLYHFEKFHCITTHHPAILGNWMKNLAPDSVWPMIDYLRLTGCLPVIEANSMNEYEKFVKPVVDPIISVLPSNDLLRQ